MPTDPRPSFWHWPNQKLRWRRRPPGPVCNEGGTVALDEAMTQDPVLIDASQSLKSFILSKDEARLLLSVIVQPLQSTPYAFVSTSKPLEKGDALQLRGNPYRQSIWTKSNPQPQENLIRNHRKI